MSAAYSEKWHNITDDFAIALKSHFTMPSKGTNITMIYIYNKYIIPIYISMLLDMPILH